MLASDSAFSAQIERVHVCYEPVLVAIFAESEALLQKPFFLPALSFARRRGFLLAVRNLTRVGVTGHGCSWPQARHSLRMSLWLLLQPQHY